MKCVCYIYIHYTDTLFNRRHGSTLDVLYRIIRFVLMMGIAVVADTDLIHNLSDFDQKKIVFLLKNFCINHLEILLS